MHRDSDDFRLDSMLRSLPPGPHASFTDQVMRRVANSKRLPAAEDAPWLAAGDEPQLPWWTRALLQPAMIGAFALAALVAGWPTELLRAGSAASTRLAAQVASQTLTLPAWSLLLAATVLGSLLLAYAAVRAAFIVGHSSSPRRASARR